MLRDFLRTVGAACIIAGASLYFIEGNTEKLASTSDTSKLTSELQALQSKLEKTEAELAKLQTATSVAETPTESSKSKAEESANDTSSEQVIKMVLLIETGMNSIDIADTLKNSKIIDDAAAFESYLKNSKLSGKIQIGKYDLDSSMATETIATIITSKK